MQSVIFLFPSQLSALVLQSKQSSPLGLCWGVASVPESSVICVLSLSLVVFRKMLLLHRGNISQSLVLLWPSRIGGAVGAWGLHLQALKKTPNCFGNSGTEVSPYILECCLFLTSTALLCAKSIQVRKAGVGAASSVSGNGLHLRWTCSFCFMS